MNNSSPHLLKAGIGLRQQHWRDVMETRPKVGFFEIHAENFLGDIGKDVLADLRRDYLFSLHAVGLSVGSADGIDAVHLQRVAELVDWLQPVFVSEHLCWSTQKEMYFNDLMPIPYTDESLEIVCRNIDRIQQKLKRSILIENVSAYFQFQDSHLAEGDFFAALAQKSGCGILCDVNNAYVNQINHGHDARAWLKSLPARHVQEIHIARHCENIVGNGVVLIDDHGSPAIDPVWQLYALAVQMFPHAASLIEWDTDIPKLDILVGEAQKADMIRDHYLEKKHALSA